MTTTPRTAAKYAEIFAEDDHEALEKMKAFAEQLEKELNEAKSRDAHLGSCFATVATNASRAMDEAGIPLGEFTDRVCTTAQRMQSANERIKRLEEVAAKLANCARFLGTWNHDSMDVLRMKDEAMDELQNLEKEKP